MSELLARASDVHKVQQLTDALASFKCCKDLDIETFLQRKALDFVERRWCSVYLILDENCFDNGFLNIQTYFTLSHKTFIPQNASKERIKATSGFKHSESVHFVLIGHLGKYIERVDNEKYNTACISSAEILDYAFEIIRDANELIPCRCVLVECSDNKKVQKMYTDYGFMFFQNDGNHYQFFKRI